MIELSQLLTVVFLSLLFGLGGAFLVAYLLLKGVWRGMKAAYKQSQANQGGNHPPNVAEAITVLITAAANPALSIVERCAVVEGVSTCAFQVIQGIPVEVVPIPTEKVKDYAEEINWMVQGCKDSGAVLALIAALSATASDTARTLKEAIQQAGSES